MATKFPLSGNQVSGAARPGPRRGRRSRRRGIALVSVVAVLVLLMIVATPFLLSMRDSAHRGERVLWSDRANAEAESLFEQVRGHLTTSVEHVERRALDSLGAGAGAQGEVRPPNFATPSADTADEFALPAELLAEMNVLSGRDHRVWDVEVRDAQSRFNLNSCSFGILANLLGCAELTGPLESSDDRIAVSDLTGFPAEDGVVRIGTEVIRYKTADPRTKTLEGCERGAFSGRPECGPAKQHEQGKLVIPEASVQIGMRPFRRIPGVWTRYTNVYEARAVSEMGVAALEPESFDRLRRFVTAWNGNAVGDGWSNPQQIRNGITAGTKAGDLVLQLKNIRYFGPGTVVMITDGVNRDYGVVVDVRGTEYVEVLAEVRHDYAADQSRIYSLARAPINVNTADAETLSLCFLNLRLRGKETRVDRRAADGLARFLKERTTEDEEAPGVYRSWKEFVAALDEARSREILNGDQHEAVLKNALNPNDSQLGFSTVPFVFRSYDVYEARVTASLLGIQGQELARRELFRTFEVSTGRSSTFVVESQADFQEQIRLSRDGKWFATYPANVASTYEGRNIPPSEYYAYATRSRFPEVDRAPGVGHAQLAPGAFRFTGRDDRFIHFDEQDAPDGIDLDAQSLEISVDGPYSANDRKADLVAYAEVPGRTDEVELGLAPFACSFWYKPRWDQDNSEHVIFDYGREEPAMNRVALRYDGEKRALVLTVWDATRETRGCSIEAPVGPGATTTFEKDRWYHVAVAVHGCSPEMMSLFVDAEQQGRALLSTKLVTSIPATGPLNAVSVEDARDFPDEGVLLVHADEGLELIEYSGKQDTSFTVRRRKARSIDDTLDTSLEPARSTPAGSRVTLYGFTAPLLTDVKRGGSRTDLAMGPWRVFRCHGTDVGMLNYSVPGTGGQPPSSGTLQFAGIGRIDGYTPVVTLTEWDTGAADNAILDDIGPQGAEGLAMVVSAVYTSASLAASGATVDPQMTVTGGGNNGMNDGASIGGADIVRYRVEQTSSNGVQVTLLQQGVSLRHYDSSVWTSPANANGGRFIPTYDYGYTTPNPNGTNYAILTNGGLPYNGAYTAFIPIALTGSTGGDYLDPADAEPQLGSLGAGSYAPGPAYVQVDGEWFKYDTYDQNAVSGKVAFYRDTRLDDVAQLWGFASIPVTLSNPSQSAGIGGGGGQQSTNTEPPRTEDYNDPANAPQAPAGSTVNTNEQNPPITTLQIAQNLDFRSWENRTNQQIHHVANTLPADHAGGVEIVACFATTPGDQGEFSAAGQGAYAGYGDLLTLRDLRGSDEQIRVQWGYRNWVGPTLATTQDWRWDRPQFPLDLRRWPSRAWTRVLKFPSGELPDAQLTANQAKVKFGKRFDDQNPAGAMVDELAFLEVKAPEDDTFRDMAYLGEVPAQLSAPTTNTPIRFLGIDENTDEIPVHWQYYEPSNRLLVLNGLPIHEDVFPSDGGVIRIDEELILYTEIDLSNGKIKGCRRGCFGTQPASHRYGAVVAPVEAFATTRLLADADEQTASFQLADNTDFPDDGYIRIADLGEIVGYTEWEPNVLSGPLRRLDAASAAAVEREEETGRQSGGGLFRGRFSTDAASYQIGDVVLAMPFRYYDRYAELSDDPESSYVQFTWTKRNAVWKRVTWDELPKTNVEVIAHVRFPGGPEWDSERIVRVGQQQMPAASDRRNWIYEIADAKAENLMNVEADRIEVRMLIRYARGAYDRTVTPPPDSWKDTPEVRKVVVEYVAPSAVMSQE